MKIQRHFTEDNQSPYSGINFKKVTSEIKNPDGSLVFKLEDLEVPESWSYRRERLMKRLKTFLTLLKKLLNKFSTVLLGHGHTGAGKEIIFQARMMQNHFLMK